MVHELSIPDALSQNPLKMSLHSAEDHPNQLEGLARLHVREVT